MVFEFCDIIHNYEIPDELKRLCLLCRNIFHLAFRKVKLASSISKKYMYGRRTDDASYISKMHETIYLELFSHNIIHLNHKGFILRYIMQK